MTTVNGDLFYPRDTELVLRTCDIIGGVGGRVRRARLVRSRCPLFANWRRATVGTQPVAESESDRANMCFNMFIYFWCSADWVEILCAREPSLVRWYQWSSRWLALLILPFEVLSSTGADMSWPSIERRTEACASLSEKRGSSISNNGGPGYKKTQSRK